MVESRNNFPFRQLSYDKFLTLNIMTNVEHPTVYKFMFGVCKSTRSFLQENYIIINNGFVNEGLITYKFKSTFNHYVLLEKLYI
jgi:hypothetical protein